MTALMDFLLRSGLNEEISGRIAGSFTPVNYQRGDFFLQQDTICRKLGFVESGLFQFYLSAGGTERTTYMGTPGSFLASLVSFLNQTPSRESIRCIAPGRVFEISKEAVERLKITVPEFNALYTQLLEYQISCIETSRNDFIFLTAEERYEKMLRNESHLLQLIPLQYLASILGVTPRHLSRIRSQIR